MTRPTIAVVMPAFREGPSLVSAVVAVLARDDIDQLVVVDASDDPASNLVVRGLLASSLDRDSRLRILRTQRAERASQMNDGAAQSHTDWLVFLHADTRLPMDDLRLILRSTGKDIAWVRFAIRIDAAAPIFRIIETLANHRSCWTAIATGDQAISVRRSIFQSIGGYHPLALMEDIDISKRLKRIGRPLCVEKTVRTSARRWQAGGVAQTVVLMWVLRFMFYIGVSANCLAGWYVNRR